MKTNLYIVRIPSLNYVSLTHAPLFKVSHVFRKGTLYSVIRINVK